MWPSLFDLVFLEKKRTRESGIHFTLLRFVDTPSPLQDDSTVSSEDLDMSEPTWMSADRGPASDMSPPGERVQSPERGRKEEDGRTPPLPQCENRHTGKGKRGGIVPGRSVTGGVCVTLFPCPWLCCVCGCLEKCVFLCCVRSEVEQNTV
ncbi:hypothetical protein Z043_121891 [Scleropages formosus]|uniref:Uncharacterized protein n=1 Tax=Scleropages formosus TaxID=113540 RepID=A0A0P7UL15_SCLFO|nr:hypothetical protein Z043_121891 [Scleropages formosus]